ncbi:MAG: fibronectin type III domain-containing protein [Clostridia bacterium]|nr:fibronectin type III domain-containing protein [Clostridia bacterium]
MKVSITDTSADFYEIESNDTRSSANVISLDENVAGMFNNSDDLDWYKITIPYSGKFTIAWSSNYPVSVRLYRTLADGTVPFENENSNGKIESINSGNTVYYLRLSQRYNSSPSFAYSMKVSITDTSADHYEIENNDKRENADRISLFEKVNGIFNNSDDLDWYRISIPINGKFTIAWSSNYPVLVKLYRTLADGTISFENENSNGKIESMNSGNTVYYLRLSQRYNSSPTFYYSFSVTSEIPTPDTFKASSTTTVNKLKWSKVNGATGYVLYRYNPSTKKYKKLTALGADTTSYKVTDLKPGREYTYAIRTYRKENGKNYFSEFKHLTTATKPLAPTVKTVSAKNHKIAMTWYKVSGASYYQVYMAVGSGKYKCVTTTDDLKFSKSGLTSGTTYSLRVRACKVFDGGVVYSAFSDVRTVTMP